MGHTRDSGAGPVHAAAPASPAPAESTPLADFSAAVSNRSMTRILARDKPTAPATPTTPTAPAQAGSVPLAQLVKGSPKLNPNPGGGSVKAIDAGDTVNISAPEINIGGTVEIDSSKLLDSETVEVGIIQQVTKYEHTGVYERPAEIFGTKPTLVRQSAGSGKALRDASPSGGKAPWYKDHQTVSKGTGVESRSVLLYDKPELNPKKRLNGLPLVGSEGRDVFDVSLAIKRGGEIHHLDTFHWEVDWNLDIAPDGTGAGGKLSTAEDGSTPTALDGMTGNEHARKNLHMRYTSVADAKMGLNFLGPERFITEMAAAQSFDAESYWHMVTAIWQSPINFFVDVKSIEEDAFWGETDDVTVNAEGGKAASRSMKLQEGKSEWVAFPIKDLFDPPSLTAPGPVKVTVGKAGAISVGFPWKHGPAKQKAGDGEYEISTRLTMGS